MKCVQARSYIESCGGQAECAKALSAEMARARVGGYYRSTSVESASESESAAFSGSASARSSVSEFDSASELAMEGTSAGASSLVSARAPSSPVSPPSPRALLLPHATPAQKLLKQVGLKQVDRKDAEAETEKAAETGSGLQERLVEKKPSSPVSLSPTLLTRASFSTPVLDRLSIDRAAQAGSRAIALR